MGAKWQRAKIEIPKRFGPVERQAIATEVLDFIRTRSQEKGLDKNNRKFAGYSEAYQKSLDFKIAGKSKKVDLTLSGDMLGALDLISHKSGQLMIGFQNGTQENARADGNIRGTYGRGDGNGPSRDFLGITKGDLNKIISKYPKERTAAVERARAVLNVTQGDEE